MSAHALVIEVRLLDGRYHGLGDNQASEWPPSPMRLFSALVAGAYGGRWVSEDRETKDAAFRWLEQLDPPTIAAPLAVKGMPTSLYVPNNDLDSVGGDPARIGEIRGSTKLFLPRLFDAETPIIYVWPFEDGEAHATTIGHLADRLHALGRGIDMGFARGEVVTHEEAEGRLARHGGPVARPGGGEHRLPCPESGTMLSLIRRHAAGSDRYAERRDGRSTRTAFRKAINPRVRQVAYGNPSSYLLYELRRPEGDYYAWRVAQAGELAKVVRDKLLAALGENAPPERLEQLAAVIKGAPGAPRSDMNRRLRFMPLPTTGYEHVDGDIRRLAIEIPTGCPVSQADIDWALNDGELLGDGCVLVPASPDTDKMVPHYLGQARRWRSITPVAVSPLPKASRESGQQRAVRETEAGAAIVRALRQAGFDSRRVVVSVRDAPNQRHGTRARDFAFDRFTSDRLFHAEVCFPEAVTGPVVLGDGRFLGLGLFEPVLEAPAIHAFALDQDVPIGQANAVCKALHRALIARVRDQLGLKPRDGIDVFYSGHEADGSPAQSGTHDHLFLSLHPATRRLLIVAPHLATHRERTPKEKRKLETLDHALSGMTQLLAGRAGAFRLKPLVPLDEGDPVIGPARTWTSATRFRATHRPRKDEDLIAFVAANVAAECRARGLPRPEVEVVKLSPGAAGRPAAEVRLTFAVAVSGPILLGQDSHNGGGLFEAVR